MGLGIVSFALFLLAVRRREGKWLAPTAIVAAFFVSATFVAPLGWEAREQPDYYDASTLPRATALALASLWALFVGYMCVRMSPRPRVKVASLEPFLTERGNAVAKVLLFGLLALNTALQVAFGMYSQAKGASTGGAPPMPTMWMMAAQTTHLLYPLFLAVAMTELSNRHFKRRRQYSKKTYIVILLVILVVSAVGFSRQMFLTVGAYLFIFYHSRVGLSKRQFVYVAAALVAISGLSLLRKHGLGATELSREDVAHTAQDVTSDWSGFLLGIAGAVAGQEVFTHVIARVPEVEGYKYGRTYLTTILGMVKPRVFTGEFDESTFDTPAHWYKRWYSPDTVGHGFDFSMLAEAYMNFGPFMVVFFGVLGYLTGRLSRAAASSISPPSTFASTISITAICFGMRNDSNSLLKTIVFYNLPLLLYRRAFERAARVRRDVASTSNVP